MATELMEYTLNITPEERHALLRLLDEAVEDTRGERRRTEDFEYREQVEKEYELLNSLQSKVIQLEKSDAPATATPAEISDQASTAHLE